MNEEITFNNLPAAVTLLLRKVERLERLLTDRADPEPEEADKWFDLQGLCEYLPDHPKRATVYGWINKKAIPYHKTAGRKQLAFLKSDIDKWMKDGKRKTVTEGVNEYFERRGK